MKKTLYLIAIGKIKYSNIVYSILLLFLIIFINIFYFSTYDSTKNILAGQSKNVSINTPSLSSNGTLFIVFTNSCIENNLEYSKFAEKAGIVCINISIIPDSSKNIEDFKSNLVNACDIAEKNGTSLALVDISESYKNDIVSIITEMFTLFEDKNVTLEFLNH